MKQELESRLGFEVTEEGFNELNKMYMACDLDKDAFARLIKSGAKVYKVEQEVKEVRYAKYTFEKTPNGCWYVGVKVGQLLGTDVKTGKIKVKFLRNAQVGDVDSYYGAQYSEEQIIEVRA